MKKTISRRSLISQFGPAGVVAWSVFRNRALAQTTTKQAKRFLYFHAPNGIPPDFLPTGSGTSFSLQGVMAPLAPFRQSLLISKVATVASAGHPNTACILTGNGETGLFSYGKGPSINTVIAERLGQQDPVGMLNLWVSNREKQGNRNTVTYDARNNFIAPEKSPAKAFGMIANAIRCAATPTMMPTNPTEVSPKEQMILDMLKDDLKDASRILGADASERRVFESHQEALFSLEARLKKGAGGGGAGVDGSKLAAICGSGGLVDSVKARASSTMTIPQLSRFMLDVVVIAFALGISRSATVFYLSEGGECRQSGDFLDYNGAPINFNLHELSHAYGEGGRPPDLANAKEKWATMVRWSVSEFAYLLSALKAIPDGASNMLDTSVSNFAPVMGPTHKGTGIVWITAGGGGYFRTGQANMKEEFHPRLLLSLLHSMGLTDVKSVGQSGQMPGGNVPLLPVA